jgi:signal transduction histidine kinase/ActR/RegA family two-component response regulator
MHSTAKILLRSILLLLLFAVAAWSSSRSFFTDVSPVVHGPVLLSDPAGGLQPAQVLDEARRRLLQGDTAPIAITTRGYWWVADVKNPGATERWVVHVGNTAIERAQLFLFDGPTLVHQDAADLLAAAREGTPDYVIGHHFPVALPPGSLRTVVLRLETEVAHNGLIFVKPETAAASQAHFHMLAIWTGAGAIAALICYNLFLGLSLRLSPYLFYVGHSTGHLIYLLTALGILGAELPVLQRYLLFNVPGIAVGVLCGALFIYRFLELPTLAPRLARTYRAFIGAMLASPLLGLLVEPHAFVTLIRSSHLVLAVLVISAALTGVAKGKREASYILVGWGGLVAMTAKGMLGVLGVVTLTVDAGIWALWAVLFEMFFLSLALADRVRRLNREKEAAQAATAAKSAFLANMSHEIRTPLNGVLGMVDVLRGTRLNALQKEYLENVRQCGSALLTLLNDILDYSRVEAGRVTLETSDFSPRRMLEELMFLLGPQAAQKGLRMHLRVDPDVPPMLVGDPGRIRQILLNLIGNAVKFTEEGEIQVRLRQLGTGPAGNRLVFSIRDTGIGIASDALRDLFGRFHQADTSIARRYGGTGLGLAIARELVTLMGGDIRITSQPGRGSHFEVELTLATGRQVPRKTEQESAVRLPCLNILVVDDDRINRLVASELLSRDGHRVVQAESGAVALARIADEAFDLILMDVSMPDMDGLDTTRRLRARGMSIPVIGLTAHVLPEQHDACIDAGMDAVIHKPIQADTLNHLLAVALQKSGLRLAPTDVNAMD